MEPDLRIQILCKHELYILKKYLHTLPHFNFKTNPNLLPFNITNIY